MDYIGVDPTVGLECSDCQFVSRLAYSELLDCVNARDIIHCDSCGRKMDHDMTTVNVVQNIIRRRMKQVNEAKEREVLHEMEG
jgi:hypothetical protein